MLHCCTAVLNVYCFEKEVRLERGYDISHLLGETILVLAGTSFSGRQGGQEVMGYVDKSEIGNTNWYDMHVDNNHRRAHSLIITRQS
jgi:hypothetical protein